MLPGEKIIGDDIAYFRNIDGEFRAVNVENGIFGIIKDVNAQDDPLIFKTLQTPGLEIIFSNVLTGPDNQPYWLGMGVDHPEAAAGTFRGNGSRVKRMRRAIRFRLRTVMPAIP